MDNLGIQIVVGVISLAGFVYMAFRWDRGETLGAEEQRQLKSVLRKVLVADDSVTTRKVVELIFFDLCRVVEAADGAEAFRTLEAEDDVDLVFADVHMGEVSGYEVARRAKQMRPKRPVLLVCGAFEPFDDEAFRDCGADAKITKPFKSKELLVRSSRLLLADGPP